MGAGSVRATAAGVTLGLAAGALIGFAPAAGASAASATEPDPVAAAEARVAAELKTDTAAPAGVSTTTVSEDVTQDDGAVIVTKQTDDVKKVDVLRNVPVASGTESVAVGTSIQVDTGAPNQTVFGNLTAVSTVTGGFTTAWPCDQPRPRSSVNNYTAGLNATPNFFAVKADATGHACFYTDGQADLMMDQYGATAAIASHTAERKFDTRTSGTPLPADGVYTLKTGLPNTTIMGNLTVTKPQGAGHTRVYPCLSGKPDTSVNNYVAGETTPNFTATSTDANGDLCFYTSSSTHLIWDQVAEATSATFQAITPTRVLDTRKSPGTPVAGGGFIKVTTATPNTTIAGNLTVVAPQAPGHTRLWNCTDPLPTASVNNFVTGEVTPNFAVVRTNASGEFCIYTSATTHLLWDQSGQTSAFAASGPTRKVDTRKWGSGPSAANEDTHWTALTTSPLGAKVRWNPCAAAINVYLNNGNTGGTEQAAVLEALNKVKQDSGLPLVYKGTTSTIPTRSNNYGLDVEGTDRIVIAFATKGTQTDVLPDGVLGIGGTAHYTFDNPNDEFVKYDGKAIYGFVIMDQNAIKGFSQAVRTTAYMHEIGHAIGLGHYNDAKQVMNPSIGAYNSSTLWGRGDLHGLSALGLPAGCRS